jgi:hypothetical protein
VRKAFEHKLNESAIDAGKLLREIPLLPKIGAAEVLLRDSEALRAAISSILEREDFFTVGADLRNRLQNLNILVKTNAELLTSQFTQALNQERNDIRSTPLWATLPEADRANFSEKLDALDLGTASDLAGMRNLVNRKVEAESTLASTRIKVEIRAREVAEIKATPPPPPSTTTPSSATSTTPRERAHIKARRRYESGAEIKPLITQLQDAVDADRPVDLELE